MEKQLKDLQLRIDELEKKVKQLSDTSFKTSAREIVNREVQFLQKVYDKSGNLVTEINT